ncbi:MAG: helix-turn-helix transcriptional regulator [Bacteroidales bacterium]|nr:helix-turn-helix transcriptional regulator [Bacteroidales bacterium]
MNEIQIIRFILKVLSIVAVYQVILLISNLLKNNEGDTRKSYLLFMFVSFACFIAGNCIFFYTSFRLKYQVGHMLNLTIFLTAPLLYLLYKARVSQQPLSGVKILVHFIPFIIVFTFIGFNIFIRKIPTYPYNKYGIALLSTLFIQGAYYMIKILREHTLIIKNTINSKDISVNTNYRQLYLLFATAMVFQFIIFLVCKVFIIQKLCVMLTSIFFLISFLLVNKIILVSMSTSTTFIRTRYRNSMIKEDYKEECLQSIQRALEDDKVFMDPLLSLDRLSKKLLIPKNILSQIINEHFGVNFNDLINKYRVNEAKRLISSIRNDYSILQVAYEVGFNSKSTFNTAFKRYTGTTPSQYTNANKSIIREVRTSLS